MVRERLWIAAFALNLLFVGARRRVPGVCSRSAGPYSARLFVSRPLYRVAFMLNCSYLRRMARRGYWV